MARPDSDLDHQSWKITTWGKLVELKYGKGLKGYRESKGAFPVFGTNGPVGWCDKPLCDYPSVIVGRKGAYRGIHYSDKPFYVIDTAFYIQPKVDFNLKWAYYNLLLTDINSMDSGSAIPSTSREDFYALPVRIPPRPIQDSIVNQLNELNDKIQLNHQTNQTLEQMAQALFKSWFVDFDPVIDNALEAGNPIPDELQERAERRQQQMAKPDHKALPDDVRCLFPSEFELTEELGWVPEGWRVNVLSDITAEIRRGISPKYMQDGGVSVINQKCIRNHEINYELCRRNDPEFRNTKGRELQVGDVLINSTGVGTLGRIAQVIYLPETTVVDSHVTVVKPNELVYPIYAFGNMMLSMERHIESLGEGSTGQTELSRKMVARQIVLVPGLELLEVANRQFRALAEKAAFNSREAKSLAYTRDILLPKLISGELRLPNTTQYPANEPR